MGYQIILSINLRRNGNISNIKSIVTDYAKNNNCEMIFENIEIAGRRSIIHKNLFILTVVFPEDEKYIIQFIKNIKQIKSLSIESIAYDNCIFRMLYSRKKKILKSNILSLQDKTIINALK